MPLNKAQRDHIETFGDVKFAEILAKSAMIVRTDARLVGLDKIRDPLQMHAALKASGFAVDPWPSGSKLELDQGMHEICQEIIAKVVGAIAATKKRKSKAA